MLIKNHELYKEYIKAMVQALDRLLSHLNTLTIQHGNIKMTNCFLRLTSSHEGPLIHIVVSDPHLAMMFDEPKEDSEAIADMIHTLISGRPPVKLLEIDRVLHQVVTNSPFFTLLNSYYTNVPKSLLAT